MVNSAQASSPVFSDGFESGTMSAWTTNAGILTQQSVVFDGAWAARATSTGTATWANTNLAAAQTDVYASAFVKVISAATNVWFLRLRTGSGSPGALIASVGMNKSGNILARNDVSNVNATSASKISTGAWHQVEIHALVNDTSSTLEVWIDGIKIADVSGTTALGTTPVGRLQLGDNTSSRTFDVAFDDVAADTSFIAPPPDLTPPSVPTGLDAPTVAYDHVTLTWNASPEGDTAGYTVYRDGNFLATVTGAATTTYDDTTVAASTAYSYAVDAFDTANNHSSLSTPKDVTTPMAPPSVPTGLDAPTVAYDHVTLTWNASPEGDTAGYTVYRNGTPIATVTGSATTTYDDTGVLPSTSYAYTVDAFDTSNNHSDQCPAINVKTPASPGGSVFTDGFEAGSMGKWTDVTQVTAQQQVVRSGAWGARATASGTPAWAMTTLPSTQTELYAETSFEIISQSTNVLFLRFRAGNSGLIAGVGVNAKDKLLLRNDVANTTSTSTRVVTPGVWHEVQLHALVSGTSSTLEVWLDGVRVNDVSGTTSLGTTPIGRLQIGDNTASRTYDVAYDDVVADTAYIAPPSTPTGLTATTVASDHIDLTWTGSPEPDVTGYTIYRNGASYAVVNSATTTSYTDSAVAPNTTYTYTIDSFDSSQPPLHSSQSPVLSVTTPSSTAADPVVAAAGDVACDPANSAFNAGNGTSTKCRAKDTAALLSNLRSTTNLQGILVLGDTQYECGGPLAYQQSYALSWGQSSLFALSHPTPGEQEYLTSGGTDCQATPGAGYFGYYGAQAVNGSGSPYYSFDIGTWHVISLNSNCTQASVGGCASTSPQYTWLQGDLAAHASNACTMVIWHNPAYSPSSVGGSSAMRPMFQLLYSSGVEMVMNGNDHVYDRYAELNGSGVAVAPGAHGLREFIVGTGGRSLGKFGVAKSANEQVRFNDSFGVLKLTLHPTSYDWQFVDASGSTSTDSGSTACH
jgi:fibronectin type 3 domain-containing protein